MRLSIVFSLLSIVGIILFTGTPFLVSLACADGDWRAEFEAVCAQTDASMTLSKEALKDLILRCENLKSRIEREDETTRKIFLRRLRSCRDLFAYMLESKNKEPVAGESTPRQGGEIR